MEIKTYIYRDCGCCLMVADLHCHTKMSDGSTGIDELIFIAKKRGVKIISITDHDTFAGYIRALQFGKKHNIEVLSGVEFSGFDYKRNRNVHIICYLCDNTDRLEGLCKKINDVRRKAIMIMLQKVMRIYSIFPEMVLRRAQSSINIYEVHIMHALIDCGYTNSFFGKVYNKLFNKQSGLAYVQAEFPDVRDLIKQIHEAGGLAVLAHPGYFDSYDLLEELAPNELDGIEVWHPKNREGDDDRFIQIAQKYNLIMTGGPDFHGMYVEIPQPLGACTTPLDQLEALKNLKIAKRKIKNNSIIL
jgi:predicted metal-dependent phosphoesterase TrpH